MLKLVVYDLDGTLIDSREDIAAAVNGALAAIGMRTLPPARVASFVGEGAELLVRRSLVAALGALESDSRPDEAQTSGLDARLVARALEAWHAHYSKQLLVKTRLYAGIDQVLALPPHRRAVLTNKPGRYAREILAGLGVEAAFARVVGGDEGPRKPDPRGLLSLCESLETAPGEALLVGDSRFDVLAGAAAGVPVCAVSWGFAPREELLALRPEHLLDDVGQLSALLPRLAAASVISS